MKNTTQSLKIVTLAFVFSFGLSYVYAWTAPSTNPPTGNVSAPINTSTTGQVKDGSFGVNGLLRGYGNAVVDGNMGIGTTTVPAYYPDSKLSIVGAPAPASGFAGYSGTTNKGFIWPNGYQPEAIFSRDTSGVIPMVPGQVSYRGGIGLGPGVGIYSVNPNPDGSPLYGDIRFHTSWWDVNAYRNSDRMIIKQDGRVGIGTITPDQKLSVAGTIETTGVSGGIKFSDGTVQTKAITCTWTGERAAYGNGGGCEDDLYTTCSTSGVVTSMRMGC